MTDAEIVRMMRAHFESLFPKVCANCGRRYISLRDYIVATHRIGPTISYDAALREWKTMKPIGAVAQANCACGSTLALTTEGMALPQIHEVLRWVKAETEHRRQSPEEVIGWIRDQIRQQVLAESGPAGS